MFTKRTFLISVFVFSVCLSKAQVVINEVMVKPSPDQTNMVYQSLKVCSQPTYGNEYIELYNADPCNAADIGCYMLATPRALSGTSDGTFRFPPGTSIPPLGFISIGGPNSGATFLLNNYCSLPNSNYLISTMDRWYIDNYDMYVVLYNETGTPVDVVYWTYQAGQASRWNNSSYNGLYNAPTNIPSPSGCPAVASLAGPSTIPSSVVSYAGAQPALGLVIHRVTDGSATWANDGLPSINDCNGVCQNPAASFTINASIIQPGCGSADGEISITANPAGTYSWAWNPSVSTTNQASGLAAGTYCVTISDGICSSLDTCFTLVNAGAFTVSEVITDATCGNPNGSIVLNPSGSGPFTYVWIPNVSTNSSASGLASGSYQITVSDGTPCNVTLNLIVGDTPLPQLSVASITEATCGLSDGSITIAAASGIAPYSYTWDTSPAQSGPTASNLPAGNYTVTVTDDAGCTASLPVTVSCSGGATLQLSSTPEHCDQGDGTATVVISGAVGNYTVAWNNGAGTETITGLISGTYTVTVTDAAGNYTQSVFVDELDGPAAGFNASPNPVTLGESPVQFTDYSGHASSWIWQFGDGESSTLQNPSHLYSSPGEFWAYLIVADAFGCTAVDSMLIIVREPFAIYIPCAFSPNGDGKNDFFLISSYGMNLHDFEMRIYDRWGTLVYLTTDINHPWDGTIAGSTNDETYMAVYNVRIQYRDERNNLKIRYSRVTLVN